MKVYRTNNIMDMYKSQLVASSQKSKEVQRDQVIVSSQALEIQKAYQAAKNTPDTRQDKVEAIKMQLKSGTYQVDAKEVSEKIISSIDIRG